jgi:hypothetical protein
MSVENGVMDHFNVQNCARQWGRRKRKPLDAEMISFGLEVSGAVRANAVYGAGVRGWGLQHRHSSTTAHRLITSFRIAWCASVQCEFRFIAHLVGIISCCVENSLMMKCKQICEVTFLTVKQVELKVIYSSTERLSVHYHALTFTRVRNFEKRL